MQATVLPLVIQANLNDRLIGELPRFFGGRLPAFRELFQNAFRAGAKRVNITLEGQVLVVEDDGTGCPDPQLLLSAGATGWDESKVVEPAGLGFFSLLASDVASAVEAQSCGWRVSLVASQVLAKKPVRVEGGDVQRGMRIQLILADAQRVEDDLRAARGYYPFAVAFNGQDMPVTKWQPTWELRTPVGLVGLKRHDYHHAGRFVAIWEHRGIEGSAFSEALGKVAKGLHTNILRDFRLHWVANPRSGVTPKLPDRNDLNANAALKAAAIIILDSVAAFLRAEAHRAAKHWPDLLSDDIKEPFWLLRTSTGKEILAELGWHGARRTAWADKNIWYCDGDGWMVENGGDEKLTKTFVEVADGDVADSINCAVALGADLPWAVVSPKGLKHRVVGRQKPRSNAKPWIALAREIRLGSHRLPFLLQESEESVLLACDADTAIAAVVGQEVSLPGLKANVSDLLEGFLAATNNDQLSEGWGDFDGEPGVDWTRLGKDLVEQVSNDYIGGARAKARQELHRIEDEQEQLREAGRSIGLLAARPAVDFLKKAIARTERTLAAEHAATAKKARLPN